MIALIDADIIAYRAACSAEQDPVEVALARIDSSMQNILNYFESYLAFLSGENNFRKVIDPSYKANRIDRIKPIHLDACKDKLITDYNTIVTDGYEADDALGFHQTEETVICSIDKDLMMIPGQHFNFVKGIYSNISYKEGLSTFYRQALIGDTSDNIVGIKGIGKVKAEKLIPTDGVMSEEEMYALVKSYYILDNKEDKFNTNLDLLWIWQVKGEKFSDRKLSWLE